uniref:MULE transposase domain-containing protein n=1 Tax=Lactuca sativa TaxID=4236 RepID=A0A9R1WSC5_LACSA|nr:hypothetical protein LSAT_V11C900464390 [Lactuca sativa]
METVDDLETIDVELMKKQRSRCKDEFLNTLTEKALDECTIRISEDEAQQEKLSDSKGDDEDKLQFHYSTHYPNVKWNNMNPICGERFKKCDSVSLVAICASDPEKFQCTFVQHTCVRDFSSVNLMDPIWIIRQFLKEIVRKPNLKYKEMQAIIQSRFHCKVSWSKCYRSKCREISLIDGKLSDHHAKVWGYQHELMRSNPGSTIQIFVTVNPDNTTTFHGMYTCFNVIKERWKVGSQRFIRFDGSFLKGRCKNELLSAIRRDANNHVYPIAWVVVDIENKPNWKFFNLKQDARKWVNDV